ncbi:MAG TPA: DUF190 domain-containing protein [Terriglobales bacterium]|nr:DUF190 domain-containing protein [Terriglobales bacterium]
MKTTSPGLLLRLHIGEDDRHQGRPLWQEILERCRAAGVEQASVYRGIEGYGASSRIHRPGLLGRTQDAPLVVTIIAAAEPMAALRPALEAMVGGGLIAVSRVELIRYEEEGAC